MRNILLGLATVLAACGDDGADDQPPPPVQAVTWYQDAGPILAKHCMSCHRDGGIAPFSLTDYADARDFATMALTQIHAGTMPPFGATEEADCTPRFGWRDDPRLSAREIETLDQWVTDGLVEGEVATLPEPASTDLAGVTQTLVPSQGFAASGRVDQFECMLLDPKLPAGTWLTGMQVRPGIPEVVHHVVIVELMPGAELDALSAAHPDGVPFDCNETGNAAVNGFTITLWTPGNQPMETPADLAVPVLGGAKFFINTHYHPAGESYPPDKTELDLRTSAVWPQKMYFVAGFGNATAAPNLLPDPDDRGGPEFRIPANAADHVERMTFTMPDFASAGLDNVKMYSANPHMHLIGTHINGRIKRPVARGSDPQNECLANGTWNFDWQRTYTYDAPLEALPSVQQGDVLDVECRWNNTLANPFVQRALQDAGLGAPIDVILGEGQSTDEMCLEIFGIATDAPPPPASGRSTPMPSDLPRLDAVARMLR